MGKDSTQKSKKSKSAGPGRPINCPAAVGGIVASKHHRELHSALDKAKYKTVFTPKCTALWGGVMRVIQHALNEQCAEALRASGKARLNHGMVEVAIHSLLADKDLAKSTRDYYEARFLQFCDSKAKARMAKGK